MSNTSNYKKYQLSQLGIKESTLQRSIDPYSDIIDPEELTTGAEEETKEHGLPPADAIKTAEDHLEEPGQKHYYSGVKNAKSLGMLNGRISPTAIATPVIGMAVRGSSTGGFPSGIDQTGIPSNTPTGRLGGYEPIPTSKDNSEVIDGTPSNSTINSSNPISNEGDPTQAEPHPHQIQQSKGGPPQDITGASTDSDATLTITQDSSAPEDNELEEPNETEPPNDMDGEESLEDEDKAKGGSNNPVDGLNEGKHKKGCQCGFCKNKGGFGKKDKKNENEDNDVEIAPTDKAKDKKLIIDKDEKPKVEEKYSPAFERMRGLANLGSRRLSSNGLWENTNRNTDNDDNGENKKPDNEFDPGGQGVDPLNLHHYKFHAPAQRDTYTGKDPEDMDENKKINKCKSCGPNCNCKKIGECKSCGCNKLNTTHDKKVATNKLNEIRRSLSEKAQAGRMNAKETQLYRLLQEVLQKRNRTK